MFPRLEKAGQLGGLTRILRQQHRAGRLLTEQVLASHGDRAKASPPIRAFIRMYRPHEAREDTVLFPALHKIMPAKQLDALGDKFEEEENRLFGDEGFEKTVDQVAAIEKQLGIYDLGQFTPK